MFKKFIQVTSILVLAGFSFFYTEKVTKIVRDNDPIMIKIKDAKESVSVSVVEPIITGDEYIAGINGCVVDVDKSYTKMKNVGEYKEELLVMSEEIINNNVIDKYIISGNKEKKNVSLVFIIKDDININLVGYLNTKRISANFFVDGSYLENNIVEIRNLSKSHSVYYLGTNGEYKDKYMIYNNNLINVNTKNESKYCLTDEKNDKLLKLCSDYEMSTIKSNYIKDNILTNVKENLSNGAIIVFDSDNIDDIKVSISYILSKGYSIVSLNDLLNESNGCK